MFRYISKRYFNKIIDFYAEKGILGELPRITTVYNRNYLEVGPIPKEILTELIKLGLFIEQFFYNPNKYV